MKTDSEQEQSAGTVAKSAWEKTFEKGIEKGVLRANEENAMKMLRLKFSLP